MSEKKTILIFGTFDIVHAGHLALFQQAKRFGKLVVVVARDTTVKKVKGQLPFHTERERKSFLEHMDYIDTVILGDTRDMYRAIRRLKPDVIGLGYDQNFFVDKLKQTIHDIGKEIHIVRFKAYKPKRCKTGQIRRYFEM